MCKFIRRIYGVNLRLIPTLDFCHRCSGKVLLFPNAIPQPLLWSVERQWSGRAGHLHAPSSCRWPGSLAASAQHPPEDRRANETGRWRTRLLAERHRGPSHTASFIRVRRGQMIGQQDDAVRATEYKYDLDTNTDTGTVHVPCFRGSCGPAPLDDGGTSRKRPTRQKRGV